MNLKEYIKKFTNSILIMETKSLGTQCVALAKHYSKNVLGVTLGRFGGSAYNGWKNKKNTFKPEIWEKVKNNPKDKNQVPPVGAIIFFDKTPKNGNYGHVAVITEAKKGKAYFKVINQNVGNGDGRGYDDRVKISRFYYKKDKVLGWYIKKQINNTLDFKKLYEEIIEKNKKLTAENINLKNKIDQVKDFVNKL